MRSLPKSAKSEQMMIPQVSAEAAVDLLRLFEGAGIDVWLDGGWAVDAALGEQTRSYDVLLANHNQVDSPTTVPQGM